MDTGVIKETESSPPETSTKRRSIRNWTIALLASLLVALIAPLLGLVGTISSMIGTFQSLEQSG
ncbi:MAG: MotA/TolQ/ExbB proton channel family protein, partial [Verrucomicrobiota bacterium]